MPEHNGSLSALFVELGLIIAGLAVLARLARRYGISAIPLYLLAGLAFGKGGLSPLEVSEQFTRIGSEIGILLLLFMLGLEYTGEELSRSLKSGIAGGAVDFILNFTPGLVTGLLLHWSTLAAALLGGVTYISSSGIIAKVLGELKRDGNPETPSILSLLVLEDLAMALYLPVVAVLLAGGSPSRMVISVSVALLAVGAVLFMAIRYGQSISAFVSHESDEIVLLTTFGAVLLVAGLAQHVNVSSAIGAFLVGIAIAYRVWVQRPGLAARMRTRLHPIYELLVNKWYFDELIDTLVVAPAAAVGRFSRNTFERVFVDETLVGGTTGIVRAGSAAVRAAQSGFVRYYAALLVLGLTGVGLYFLLQT